MASMLSSRTLSGCSGRRALSAGAGMAEAAETEAAGTGAVLVLAEGAGPAVAPAESVLHPAHSSPSATQLERETKILTRLA